MSPKEKLLALKNGQQQEGVLFFPIVMHFAARLAGQKYSDFARDYREMGQANIACVEQAGMDYVTVMCDPYRETSAFGGVVSYPEDAVPRCTTQDLNSIEELEKLKTPDVNSSDRIRNCIDSILLYKEKLGDRVRNPGRDALGKCIGHEKSGWGNYSSCSFIMLASCSWEKTGMHWGMTSKIHELKFSLTPTKVK